MSKFNWGTAGIPAAILSDHANEFRHHAQDLTILDCAATLEPPQGRSAERFFSELVMALNSHPDPSNPQKS